MVLGVESGNVFQAFVLSPVIQMFEQPHTSAVASQTPVAETLSVGVVVCRGPIPMHKCKVANEFPLGVKSFLASWAGKGLAVNDNFCVFHGLVVKSPIGFGHHVLVHLVQKGSVPSLGALPISMEADLRFLGIGDCSSKPLKIGVYPFDCGREIIARDIIIPPNNRVEPEEVFSDQRSP